MFFKMLDKLIGKALVFFIPRVVKSRSTTAGKASRILFIRPGGIGDMILLMPAIAAVKINFPTCSIDILCEKRNAEATRFTGHLDNVYKYHSLRDIFRCLNNTYDIVIDTEQWYRLSAVIAYLTRARIRIGFRTNERESLLTHKIGYSHDDYEVNSFLNLLKPILDNAPDFNAEKPFIEVQPVFLSEISSKIGDSGRVVAFFTGTAVKEKQWGLDKFCQVANALHAKGCKILLIGSAIDKKASETILKCAPMCIDITGRTDLNGTASVLKQSSLLLTGDSGMMHLAYAVGTPTVSLFGASNDKKWGPKGKKHSIIRRQVPCSPCSRFGYVPSCQKRIECLTSISAEEVIRVLEKLLN